MIFMHLGKTPSVFILTENPTNDSVLAAVTDTQEPRKWGPCHAGHLPAAAIVDHFLVVPCLSCSISARGSTRDLCWHVPGGGDPAFVTQQCGVKWIHAAARHGALCGACRGRRASDAPLLLAWSMIMPQMLVTPKLPFAASSCHLIPRACLYSRHKLLTERNVFTPSVVWGFMAVLKRTFNKVFDVFPVSLFHLKAVADKGV